MKNIKIVRMYQKDGIPFEVHLKNGSMWLFDDMTDITYKENFMIVNFGRYAEDELITIYNDDIYEIAI